VQTPKPGGFVHEIDEKTGDWKCPGCQIMVYGSKSECFRCGTQNPSTPGYTPGRVSLPDRYAGGYGVKRPGDWTCPQCDCNCFASKSSCFKCGADRPAGAGSNDETRVRGHGGFGDSGRAMGRSGDWTCPTCFSSVFAAKMSCFKCNTAKPEFGADSTRTDKSRAELRPSWL
jgi:hypothetical protein